MAEATLTYFDIRGRAELARLVLEHSGTKYNDKRVTFEEWPELKKTMPLGQVPVYSDQHVQDLPQSNAIARHVANVNGLLGSNPGEQARIDAVVETAHMDSLEKALKAVFAARDDESKRGEVADVAKAALANLESVLKRNNDGTGFFVGDSVSYADLVVFNAVHNFLGLLNRDAYNSHALLKAHHDRVAALPNIAAYLASDRLPKLVLPPFAKALCTPEDSTL